MARGTSISVTDAQERDIELLRAYWGMTLSEVIRRAVREAVEGLAGPDLAAEEEFVAQHLERVMERVAQVAATTGDDWGITPGEIALTVLGEEDDEQALRLGALLETRGYIERHEHERSDGRGVIETWRPGPRYRASRAARR